MTRTQQNADWIKSQQKLIINKLSEVTSIIMLLNLEKQPVRDKFNLELTVSTIMNGFGLRVSDGSHEQVEISDVWCVEDLFIHGMRGELDKERTILKIDALMVKIKAMKEIALKYSKLISNN